MQGDGGDRVLDGIDTDCCKPGVTVGTIGVVETSVWESKGPVRSAF